MRLANKLVLSCTFVLLSSALLGVVGIASAQNLILNPGFETGDLSNWVLAGESGTSSVTVLGTDNGPSAPGTNVAFLDNQAEALGLTLKQTTAPGSATGGTVFYSFDLKLGVAEVGGVFFVEIFAEQSGVGIIGGSGLLGNYTPAGWTNFSGSFTAPVGTDFLTIQFTAVTGADPQSVSSMSVDNVWLGNTDPVATESMSWSGLKALHD